MGSTDDTYRKFQDGKFLVVHRQRQIRVSLRASLRSFGVASTICVASLDEGINQLSVRDYTHILFEAREADPKAHEFATKSVEMFPEAILIGLFEPAYVDEFFSMLHIGVRGFLVVPCNAAVLEDALLQATGGLNIPEEFRTKSDRNEALVTLIIHKLDLLAESLRQMGEEDTQSTFIKRCKGAFRDSVRMSRRLFKGDRKALRDAFAEACEELAEQADERARTRLGRLRRKLAQERRRRTKLEEEEASSPEA